MPYRRAVKVSDEVYRGLWELARRHGLESPNQLLEKLLAQGVTPSAPDRVTLSVDCIARRVRKGDKLLNVYYVECRDGARAVVHRETLADLVAKFKLKIKVVE
jgi:phage gp46-like protein